MEDKKRRTISFTVDNADYEEILEYAWIKGHDGKNPISNFARYAVLTAMQRLDLRKNYPLPTIGDETLKKVRTSKTYQVWRKAVLKRDKHCCQKCGSRLNLHVHHILPFSKYPELRFEITNGITLCARCHIEEHKQIITGATRHLPVVNTTEKGERR
jgi:hypothetical protein